MKKLLTCFLLLGSAGMLAAQSLKLANTLQSGMVIQQQQPLHIWGTASPGATVEIKADWSEHTHLTKAAAGGEWGIDVQVPATQPGNFTQHRVSVSSKGRSIWLDSLLIGDVWLCSGQSNMDMTLKPFLPWLLGALHFEREIEYADRPQIRLYDVTTDFSATPRNDCAGTWKVCSPSTAADFSALAYFFARDVFDRTKIPVGLVVSSLGGSSGQAWVSRDSLQQDKILNEAYLYPYDTSSRSKEMLDATVTFEKVVRPTLLYNAMIYPLQHLRFKGILWYQGESNRRDSSLYTRLGSSLIRNWRNLFRQPELPFYYVQVAPYNWMENDSTAFEYALLREAQGKIRDQVPHTAMALTMDIADPNDIHPRNKQDLAYRLAHIALAKDYGITGLIYQGPAFKEAIPADTVIKVRFKESSLGSGLTTNDSQPPRHFFVAGADHIFHPAEARIEGNEVWLQSADVLRPVAVRYAFTNFPVTNLCNKEGFPAEPFRSSF